MGMVNVIIGNEIRKVSKSAYEKMFKPNGYRLADGGFSESVEIEEEQPIDVEAEEIPEYNEEIPISQMNKSQLADFAKEHGIDTHSARTVQEARKIIQDAIKKQNV